MKRQWALRVPEIVEADPATRLNTLDSRGRERDNVDIECPYRSSSLSEVSLRT